MIAVAAAVVPARRALLRLAMARSMLDTDRVAVHDTALPPLAGAVLCSLASALGAALPRPPACWPRCCPSSRKSCTSSRGSALVSGL